MSDLLFIFPIYNSRIFTYTMTKPLIQLPIDFSATDETGLAMKETSTYTIPTPPVITVTEEKITPMAPAQAPLQKASEKNTESKPVSTRGRRSLKDIGLEADLIQVPEDNILFQKQYYSIGEVAGWFRVNQSLLRYWESEFDILQPRKNKKGDRFFRPVDVKNLQLIYDLLRRRKFTIEGAKDYLKNSKKTEEKFAMIQSLEKIKAFMLELKAGL